MNRYIRKKYSKQYYWFNIVFDFSSILTCLVRTNDFSNCSWYCSYILYIYAQVVLDFPLLNIKIVRARYERFDSFTGFMCLLERFQLIATTENLLYMIRYQNVTSKKIIRMLFLYGKVFVEKRVNENTSS